MDFSNCKIAPGTHLMLPNTTTVNNAVIAVCNDDVQVSFCVANNIEHVKLHQCSFENNVVPNDCEIACRVFAKHGIFNNSAIKRVIVFDDTIFDISPFTIVRMSNKKVLRVPAQSDKKVLAVVDKFLNEV